MHLFAYFVQPGAEVDAGRAALVTILNLCGWKMMEHHLHHGELIQVGVQQRINDHSQKPDLLSGQSVLSSGNWVKSFLAMQQSTHPCACMAAAKALQPHDTPHSLIVLLRVAMPEPDS